MLQSDPNGLVSAPVMTEPSEQRLIEPVTLIDFKVNRSPHVIVSNIKRNLGIATELKHPKAVHHWLITLGRTLANHGRLFFPMGKKSFAPALTVSNNYRL